MNRLSIGAAILLPMSLSPLACSAAFADGASASPGRPIHKSLSLRHFDGEDHSLAAQARAGAFLEMTPAAP